MAPPLPPSRTSKSNHGRGSLSLLGNGIWLGLLIIPLVAYGSMLYHRPLTQSQPPKALFQGIVYERVFLTQHRPQLIHRLTINLTAPGLIPWTTLPIDITAPELAQPLSLTQQSPAQETDSHVRRETIAQKATTALATHSLQLAINANFFFPFVEQAPWRTAPAEGEPVSLIGTAIAQGNPVSPAHNNWPALCFRKSSIKPSTEPPVGTEVAQDTKAIIASDGQCPVETQTAVAGNLLIMDGGEPGDITGENLVKPYPMVIAALDSTGQQLQLILIDGKQPFYSEGITLPEAIALLQSWGIHDAIRLDGGGSTSLAVEGAQGQALLINAAIQAKVPGRERPVANHLGFYAQPLSD